MPRGGYQHALGRMRRGRGGSMRKAPKTPPKAACVGKGKDTTPIGAKACTAAAVKGPPAPCIQHKELCACDNDWLRVAHRAQMKASASAPVSTFRKTLSHVAFPKPGPVPPKRTQPTPAPAYADPLWGDSNELKLRIGL